MSHPFTYPQIAQIRRHGPVAYADRASYRPWLRDEFTFRCVYCLLREQWGRTRGVFDIDHFQPSAIRPDRAADYDNLLYACAACNSVKQAFEVPDPLPLLTQSHIRVSENGRLQTESAAAACLIELLDLNGEDAVEFRMTWIGIVALAARFDSALYRRLMGFPDDLPDLGRLRPPGGNKRPEGVSLSYHAKRSRGELPELY